MRLKSLAMLMGCLCLTAICGAATTQPATQAAPREWADVARIKPGDSFLKKHESFLKRGREGKIGVLLLGDSITEGWNKAPDVYHRAFDQYSPANFGIGGDKTQHVLWRIDHGELDDISPKVVVLMIGTNNVGDYSVEEITHADVKIVREIHQKLPETKVLVLGIFPRSVKPTDPAREKIKEINKELAKLDDGVRTRYLDIGDKFLDENGVIQKDIMGDALHPTPKGYQIWADAMQSTLDDMMK